MHIIRNHALLIIAGTGSGCGKTSITAGLISVLRKKGLSVQPFKVGPDYLDPTWLSLTASRPCINLDTWMSSPEYVTELVNNKMADADIGIIEGAMGLYDGARAISLGGSTAEIARLLNAPVILIANACGSSRSFAATVYGFVNFPDAPHFAGIIANHCGSKHHAEILSEALSSVHLPALCGAIQNNAFPPLPDRHLGLHSASTLTDTSAVIDSLSTACETSLAVDNIVYSAQSEFPVHKTERFFLPDTNHAEKKVRIAYAYDNAFHFYYQDTFDLLSARGAEFIPFSPLHDNTLPDAIDGVYLGGGYPEVYAHELSENSAMLSAIRSFADSGKVVFAECGGLIYCGKSITDLDNNTWNLSGILPIDTKMNSTLQRLGYCTIKLRNDCLLGKKGSLLRGHEFHYSSVVNKTQDISENCFDISYCNGNATISGFVKDNILASYVHLHWGSSPETAAAFISACRSTN